jgi:hypothetical protein
MSNEIRPAYYDPDSLYEPRKVIREWGLGFNLGNCLKYIGRAGKKEGASRLDDLRKALTYLEFEIEEEREVRVND